MFCSTAAEQRDVPQRGSSRNGPEAAPVHRLTRPAPTVASALRVQALLPLLLHLVRRRVVDVGLSLSQQLLAKPQDDGKMVAGVGELVWADLKHGNIFQDHLRREEKKKIKSSVVMFLLLQN